jgi:hypothetical protein
MRAQRVITGSLIALACSSGVALGATYDGALSAANEVPPTASAASGYVSVQHASGATLQLTLDFNGLSASAVAAHIHCCVVTPGTNVAVAVPMPGFPAATSGTYANTFNLDDMATYSSAFLAANGGTAATAKAALLAGMDSDRSYFNIHTSTFPGGEIRANLVSAIFHNGFDP